MYFNVSQLMREPSGSHRVSEVDEILPIPEDGPSVRVHGRVELVRTDKSIWVSGTLDTEVPCACSRCLIEFGQPLHLTIEEECFPLVDVATGARLELPEDRETLTIDPNHILDLREAVRQYSVLGTPMNPVCKESCAGLCPTCGADLNMGGCGCDAPLPDGRWAALLEQIQTDN